MTATSDAPRLRRDLSPLSVGLLAFSALSPTASVYLYGAGVIHIGGTGAILALVIGGAITSWLGLMFGELAAAFPRAGGIYPAFVALLGPRLAFPYVLLMITVAITTTSFALLGLADYVRVLVPGLPEFPTALTALFAAGGMAVLSVRTGAHLTTLFLAIEVAALLILTFCAFLHPWHGAASAVVHPFVVAGGHTEPLTLRSFALATVVAAYTTGGALFVVYFAEELEDAHLRIGRIVSWVSPMAAVVIAVPIFLVILGAPDRVTMMRADAPFAAFLDQTASPLVSRLVSAGVVVAVFNAIVAAMMSYSRLIFSTARDGVFPPIARRLGQISSRWGSPLAATLALCLAVAVVMPLGERMLLMLSSNENLLEYLLTGLAVIVGRRSRRTGEHYRVRPHPGLAICGILVSLALGVADWFDPAAGRPSLYVLVVIIALGLVWYGRIRHRIAKPEIG